MHPKILALFQLRFRGREFPSLTLIEILGNMWTVVGVCCSINAQTNCSFQNTTFVLFSRYNAKWLVWYSQKGHVNKMFNIYVFHFFHAKCWHSITVLSYPFAKHLKCFLRSWKQIIESIKAEKKGFIIVNNRFVLSTF